VPNSVTLSQTVVALIKGGIWLHRARPPRDWFNQATLPVTVHAVAAADVLAVTSYRAGRQKPRDGVAPPTTPSGRRNVAEELLSRGRRVWI